MTLMHKTISVTATIMAMVSRRICLWLQSIIEKQTSKAKVSWAIVGFGNRNTMQALPLENKTISQNHILLCVYEKMSNIIIDAKRHLIAVYAV